MDGKSYNEAGEAFTHREAETKTSVKKKKGALSRLWSTIFRTNGDNYRNRLEHISKEEVAVRNRIRKRSQRWRKITRQLLMFSVILEVVAVAYAVMTRRLLDSNGKMTALRLLPMFLLPAISSITYSLVGRYTRMCDKRDHKTLEELRTESQEIINELKEKTNFYMTQQLIQRYDPDPYAKAAATTVLASKLSADSGFKVHVEGDSTPRASFGKSHDVEISRTSGLRSRMSSISRSSSLESTISHYDEEILNNSALEGDDISQQDQLMVEPLPQTISNPNEGGWIARLAALLVGEDPTQSYALICSSCYMHNGLARKEDLPYVTYYCLHCKALNRPKPPGEGAPACDMHPDTTPKTLEDAYAVASAGVPKVDSVPATANDSPVG